MADSGLGLTAMLSNPSPVEGGTGLLRRAVGIRRDREGTGLEDAEAGAEMWGGGLEPGSEDG